MGFALNIEALLKQFEISPSQLARTVGVSPATVSRWRQGKMNVRDRHLRRICEEFGLEKDDLLSDAHGLAARAQNAPERTPSSIPLLTDADVANFRQKLANGSVAFVEVPSTVVRRHPESFAFAAPDGCACDIPSGTHVVVDPATEPGDGSIVVVEGETVAAPALQRWADRRARGDGGQVVGTVVWFQSSGMLG